MSRRRFNRPSPAMAVALLALFVALGGTGYAALTLPKNSVGTKQLKKHAVTLKKVKPSARRALHGTKGDRGPRGPRGAAGPGAAKLDASLPSVPTATKTLFSRKGLSVAVACSRPDDTTGDTVLDLRFGAAGAGATVSAGWTKEGPATIAPYQDGVRNGTLTVGLRGHSGFSRAEGQAVLRTDGLVATVVFHAGANAGGGPCDVTGTVTPAT
jgi:hypothetical protein